MPGNDTTLRRDEEGWTNPFSNIYATGDGRHLMLALAVPKQEWPRLAAALKHPEWAADPRFADMRSALKNRHALRALIASGLAAMTIEQADAALKAHDVTFSVVARIADVVDDPQLIANGLVVGTDASVPGYERTLATPFKTSRRSAAQTVAGADDRRTQPRRARADGSDRCADRCVDRTGHRRRRLISSETA